MLFLAILTAAKSMSYNRDDRLNIGTTGSVTAQVRLARMKGNFAQQKFAGAGLTPSSS